MSQGTDTAGHQPPPQQPGGAWLSFPALFSDGDRDLVHNEAEGSDAHSYRSEASELSALRLDISDIQEAIKNHDLWVQDCVAMRTDIDDLQENLRENLRAHENWMGHLSGALRQIQERENRFEIEIQDLRRRVGGTDSAPPTPPAKVTTGVKRVSSKSDVVSHMISSGAGGTAALTIPAPATKAPADRDPTVSGAANDRMELGLTQQLGQGLRMLRTMVTAVEGSLVRQLDGERAARRAALADIRTEFSQAFPSISSPTAPDAEGSPIAKLVGDTNVGIYDGSAQPPDFFSQDESLKRHQAFSRDPDFEKVRESLAVLERRAEDRTSEVEVSLAELRTELVALRAEQQLQAVAAGALALAGGHLSPQARLRSIKALEERVLVGQKEAAQKKKLLQTPQECRQQEAGPGQLGYGNGGWLKAPPDAAVENSGEGCGGVGPAGKDVGADAVAPRPMFQGESAEL